ncbi:hypothetical protein [Agrococcus jejuensis]|uniref:LPXTG-motif cell wall anchor domain-containing protein n=1 Tax=Agrococcus jejuensis TaxID=399736 RepID=A0A1G8F2S7_9MICO|nr:hypothetical protein [Agrococcus jejuensis]SDH76398.1 hypothetical protein SAMN04489720_2304 [Agrococcus jejuensis]
MPRSMRRASAAALTAILALGGIGLGAAAANADSTQTFSGVLQAGDATWERTWNCDGESAGFGQQYYDVQTFTVPETGGYRIDMTSHALANDDSVEQSADGYFHLYEGAFDPTNPTVGCLAADDDGTGSLRPRIDIGLTAGVTYTLVTTQYSNGADASQYAYTTQIDGLYPVTTFAPAAGQTRAFTEGPARLSVTFSEPVEGFDADDVDVFGAGPTTVSVTGSGASYEVLVDGFESYGSYFVRVETRAVTSVASGRPATQPDEITLVYVESLPTVTIAPVGDTTIATEPATFAVTFSEPVEGFAADDVVLGGTAGASTVAVTGDEADYVVTVGGFVGAGTVEASIRAEAAYVLVGGGEGPPQQIGTAPSDTATVTYAPVVAPSPTATAPAPTTSAPVAPAPTTAAPAVSPSGGELPQTGGSPLWIGLLLAGALVAAGVGVRRMARIR